MNSLTVLHRLYFKSAALMKIYSAEYVNKHILTPWKVIIIFSFLFSELPWTVNYWGWYGYGYPCVKFVSDASLRFTPNTTHLLFSSVVPWNSQKISPFCLQRFKPDFQSGISLQRIGCFPINVNSQNLHFTKTVLYKHRLSHFTCYLLKSKSIAFRIDSSLGPS